MKAVLRGIILCAALGASLLARGAWAAPERLSDDVRDAVPDQPGAWNVSWAHLGLDLEGAMNGERTVHDFFKLRYTFNPKVSAMLRYSTHDLAGDFGLLSPVLDGMDSAAAYEFDLHLNLMNVPAVQADPAKNVAYAAGSSFGIGLAGTQYQLQAGSIDQDETMLRAYLLYSTDLTEELRAHTVFSSARLSGDTQSGSLNRVGAGLDYALSTGEHPLVLMANGIIDIYNFREPSFNTSRVSRFDLGLRYRVARSWYASLGWITANDSENDNSGSGLFASLNYVTEPPPPCPVPPETPPAAEQPAASADGGAQVADAAAAQVAAPEMMALVPPQPAASKSVASAGDRGTLLAQVLGNTTGTPESEVITTNAGTFDPLAGAPVSTGRETLLTATSSGAAGDALRTPDPALTAADTATAGGANASSGEGDGIVIPGYPGAPPLPTPAGAVMVRPPVSGPQTPLHTADTDIFVRPVDPPAEVPAEQAAADGGLIAAAPQNVETGSGETAPAAGS